VLLLLLLSSVPSFHKICEKKREEKQFWQ